MQGSRAQKEMKRNPSGGMHTAVMPRGFYARGGSSVYKESRFEDDWDKSKMPKHHAKDDNRSNLTRHCRGD